MTIQFLAEPPLPEEYVVPSLKFEDCGKYKDCTLYIDHIPVAYFDGLTGGLALVPIEIGPYISGDDTENKKYLESKGFELDVVPKKNPDFVNYYIKISKG